VEACPSGALTPDGFDVDRCFFYWGFGFKRLPPERNGRDLSACYVGMLRKGIFWWNSHKFISQMLIFASNACAPAR
jgi:hypothetical protein